MINEHTFWSLDLFRIFDLPLMITLSFWKRTSHGDGGSPSVHESSGSGSVDVSTVKSPNNTNPDSPGCRIKMKKKKQSKLLKWTLHVWSAMDALICHVTTNKYLSLLMPAKHIGRVQGNDWQTCQSLRVVSIGMLLLSERATEANPSILDAMTCLSDRSLRRPQKSRIQRIIR